MAVASIDAADRRPAILVTGWDAGDDAWSLVEDLSGEPWHPTGARTVQPDPDPANPSSLTTLLQDTSMRALLLVGRSHRSEAFELQVRAALGDEIRPDGDTRPSVARATAPASEIMRALSGIGLQVKIVSDHERDTGSELLFRVLSDFRDAAEPPAIGLLRAPAGESETNVLRAVKAAVQAIANHLPPLPRRAVA